MYDILKFNAELHSRTGHYSKLNLACRRDLCPRFNRETEATQAAYCILTRSIWHILLYVVFSLRSYGPVL